MLTTIKSFGKLSGRCLEIKHIKSRLVKGNHLVTDDTALAKTFNKFFFNVAAVFTFQVIQ